MLVVRTMAPYYVLKTTNAAWAAHCQGHCLNFLVDITYLWIMVLYWYLHASPVCKVTGLETFGVRGHCMKLGRGTLWTHRNMLARQVSYKQYEQSVRTPLFLVHGTWFRHGHVKLGHSNSWLTGRVSLQFCCYIMIAIIALAPEATDILIVPLSIITFICFYLKCCRLNGRH